MYIELFTAPRTVLLPPAYERNCQGRERKSSRCLTASDSGSMAIAVGRSMQLYRTHMCRRTRISLGQTACRRSNASCAPRSALREQHCEPCESSQDATEYLGLSNMRMSREDAMQLALQVKKRGCRVGSWRVATLAVVQPPPRLCTLDPTLASILSLPPDSTLPQD